MTRQIKFRAWDKENKKMLPHSGMYFEKMTMFSEDMEKMSKIKQYLNLQEDFISAIQKKYPLMQFTGLLDKNGKEIYEGDIIGTEKGVHQVVWNLKRGSWSCTNSVSTHRYKLVDYLHKYTVVGNIYENHELLNA